MLQLAAVMERTAATPARRAAAAAVLVVLALVVSHGARSAVALEGWSRSWAGADAATTRRHAARVVASGAAAALSSPPPPLPLASAAPNVTIPAAAAAGVDAAPANGARLLRALDAIRREQLALPHDRRRYVVCAPSSGLGNKLRVLNLCLATALAHRRLLLMDDGAVGPLYAGDAPLYPPPRVPWLVSQVPPVAALLADGAAARDPARVATFLNYNDHKLSPAWRCWEARGGAFERCAGGAGVAVIVSNQALAAAAARADVLPSVAAALGDGAGDDGDTTPRAAALQQQALHWALFPRPGPALAGAVADAQAALGWAAARLRVALHMRFFVDAKWGVPPRKLSQRYFDCVSRHVRAVQDASGLSHADTLVYVATDAPKVRDKVRARLGGLGAVRWVGDGGGGGGGNGTDSSSAGGGGGGFFNVADAPDTGARTVGKHLHVHTEWHLLGDAQLVVGTYARYSSTFGFSAALRSGARYVEASLTGDHCELQRDRLLPGGEAALLAPLPRELPPSELEEVAKGEASAPAAAASEGEGPSPTAPPQARA